MKQIVKQPVRLLNGRSGEEWLCDDLSSVRNVDGVDFIEVYKESNPRRFWMNKATLTKIKSPKALTKTRKAV